MNKLLIICDMFPPAFAPRMGYLCKYLTRMGWEVTVVTEYIEDNTFEFLTGYADVYCVRYYKASGKISKHIEWMWVMFLDILFGYKDMKIINACIPLIKTNQYKGILCSTYRTFPLTAAKTLAIHTNLPFVVDLRDIIEQYASNEYISHKFHTFSWLDAFITKRFRKRLLRKRNNALEVADCVTTVSPWHVEVLKQYNPNVKLIYNDYNCYQNPENIIHLVDYINSDGKVCDGIGMQSHLDITDSFHSATNYAKALEYFRLNCPDLEIQITELDATMVSTEDKPLTDEDQAAYYDQIMNAILTNKKNGGNITALIIWSLYDGVSWRPAKFPCLFNGLYLSLIHI